MPKAGQPYPLQVFVGDAVGDGVPDLVEASFTLHALLDTTVVVLVAADFDEIGDGYYVLTRTMPATTGRLRVDIRLTDPTVGTLDVDVFEGDVTAHTLDDVATIAARPPSISLASNVGKDSPYTLEVFKGDAVTLRFPVYDEEGDLRTDLPDFDDFRFSIQNQSQTASGGYVPYDLISDVLIRGGADGYIEVDLPEDCSAYGMLTAGIASVSLYWSVDGDPNDDTKTKTLRGGRFVIKRKETPSP